MGLAKRDRQHILKNYPGRSLKELARELKATPEEVREVLSAAGQRIREDAESGPAVMGYVRAHPLGVALIIAVVSVVYLNSMRNGFHYDDIHSLLENLGVQVEWSKNPESRTLFYRYFYEPHLFSSRPGVAMPRPILMCTFGFNYMLTHYDPWSWILVNLLLHLANSLIIYVGLCHLSGRPRIALFTALLFAVHPINTETANYINCRSESLSAFWMLLTMYFFARSLREERLGLRIGSVVGLAFGLLTKELVFVTPALLVAIDVLFIYPENGKRIPLFQRLLFWYAPILGTWFLYLVYREWVFGKDPHFSALFFMAVVPILVFVALELARVLVLKRRQPSTQREPLPGWYPLAFGVWLAFIFFAYMILKGKGEPFRPVRSIADNLVTQSRVLVSYIRLLFFPFHQNISYENDIYTVAQFIHNPFTAWLLPSMAFLGALAFLAVYWRRRYPVVSFAIANFFITLSITSSIIPLNAIMNEHRLYLPSLGACLLLAALLDQSAKDINRRRGLQNGWPLPTQAFGLAVFLVFVALTVNRNYSWLSDFTVWRDSIRKAPVKAQVVADLGNAYYRGGRSLTPGGDIARDGKIAKGEKIIIAQTFLEEVPVGPINQDTRAQLDRLYLKGLKRAEQLYNWAKRVEYSYYKAWHNLGTIYYTFAQIAEQKGDKMEAKRDLEKGIQYFYKAAQIYANGESFNDMASTMLKLSDSEDDPALKKKMLEQIIEYYKLAYQYNPELYKAPANAGQILARLGRCNEAVPYYDQAIKINPMDPQLYAFKADCLVQLRKFREAGQTLDRCLQVNPTYPNCLQARQKLQYLMQGPAPGMAIPPTPGATPPP